MRLAFVLSMAAWSTLVGCGSDAETMFSENGASSMAAGGSGGSGQSSGGSGQDVGSAGSGTSGGGGSGGAKGTGGAGSATGGAAGATRDAGAAGTAMSPDAASAANCTMKFPTPASTTKVSATIKVSGPYDGTMKRFVSNGLGDGSQGEGQEPLFLLADGSVLKNVIIGNPGADGIHCSGTCTLQNVWWEDVGEDAATLLGKSSTATMTIDGGGAMHAADKVFQHNGAGTIIVKNFFVSDFGKLYRSCGNCNTQYARHLVVENLIAVNLGGALAGVNTNYNDSASFKGLVLCDRTRKMAVCDRYTGNDTGDEPPLTGSGPDGKYCIYTNADLQWVFF